MEIVTERLKLRPWTLEDAPKVFEYCSDPVIGDACGWVPHKDLEHSKTILKTILMRPEIYAITIKDTGEVIGSIQLMTDYENEFSNSDKDCELGYWLGKKHWGNGYMQEAIKVMIKRAFEVLGYENVFAGVYKGADNIKKLIEGLGFKFKEERVNVLIRQLNSFRTSLCYVKTREDYFATNNNSK